MDNKNAEEIWLGRFEERRDMLLKPLYNKKNPLFGKIIVSSSFTHPNASVTRRPCRSRARFGKQSIDLFVFDHFGPVLQLKRFDTL